MKILILLIFIGLVMIAGAALLFGFSVKNEEFDHPEEMSMLPLEDEKNADETNHL